jgi:monoamine oxidase
MTSLDRRRATLGLVGALAAGPAAAQPRRQTTLPAEPDVAIIGAGSAGLAAARELQRIGRTCLILEATGRIGGRAYTDTATFGAPFDHGCAWLHAADRNPYRPLAEQYGFTLAPHDYALDRIHLGARRADDAEVATMHATEAEMSEAIEKGAIVRDAPASQFVDMQAPWAETAATYLGAMDFAVDLDELSSRDYAEGDDLEPNMLCRQGFGAIVARYGAGAPVRLKTPVTRVAYGGSGVELTTNSGAVRAKKVIVTVSTGVLASGALRWDPVLPDWKEQAFHDLPMGLLVKLPLLVRDERFGVAAFTDLFLERPGRNDIYFLGFPFDAPLMIGFVGGDFAWEMSAAGQAAGVDYATSALVDLFGSAAARKVSGGLMTGWAANRWTRGAYSAATPGRFTARASLARPIADRIFFAGEALGGRLVQTCAGAFNSGQLAARHAHAALL